MSNYILPILSVVIGLLTLIFLPSYIRKQRKKCQTPEEFKKLSTQARTIGLWIMVVVVALSVLVIILI